jgi:NADH-quinone oxidoreductase E subunit
VTATAIDEIMGRHPGAHRDSLIPILQEVQAAQGFLSKEAILEISRRLNLPASKVYGVATFYNQFRFRAPGKYNVQVCRGTACHVKGSSRLLDKIVQILGIKPGETTRDGQFSIEIVSCLGACGLAPVMAVNGEFYAGVTADRVQEILDTYRGKAEAHGQNG